MVTKPFLRGTPDEAIRSKRSARKYFYLDGKLYKQLRFDNGQDLMVAWCYDDAGVTNLSLSYVKRKRRPTFTVTQAAAMLNRSRMNINHLYLFGVVTKPKRSYFINTPDNKDTGSYRLTEQDVYSLHAYYATSRAYKKYESSSKPLPSKMQVSNMMKYEKIPYVQTKEGNFVPVWEAPNIEDW